MRILGIQPSSVILSITQCKLRMKCDYQVMRKQVVAEGVVLKTHKISILIHF